jgi:hypothetical protein
MTRNTAGLAGQLAAKPSKVIRPSQMGRFGLLAIVFLVTLGSWLTPDYSPPPRLPPASVALAGAAQSDMQLYIKIIARMEAGGSYYATVAAEHRAAGFPLKPFVTVRLPTLAWINTWLGPNLAIGVLAALIAAATAAWVPALELRQQVPPADKIAGKIAVGMMGLAMAVLLLSPFRHFHESWAAPLIALSIALQVRGFTVPAVIAGLCAVLIRELTLPFLLMMGGLALLDRNWRAAAGWAVAIGVAGLALTVHAHTLAAILLPDDLESQGWQGFGGWPFLVRAMQATTLLELFPAWVAKLVVPLSLFGWLMHRSAAALRVSGLMLGYALALLVFARDTNKYWAILLVPYLLAGLALVPGAVAAMLRPRVGARLNYSQIRFRGIS